MRTDFEAGADQSHPIGLLVGAGAQVGIDDDAFFARRLQRA